MQHGRKAKEQAKPTAKSRNTTFRKRANTSKRIQKDADAETEALFEKFSEFESYSLIISDSPVAKKPAPNQCKIQTRGAISTSTPDTDVPSAYKNHLRAAQVTSNSSLMSPRLMELRTSERSKSKLHSPTSASHTPTLRSRHLNSGSKSSMSTSTPHASYIEVQTSPGIGGAELSHISSPICAELEISPSVELSAKVKRCGVILQRLKLDDKGNFHTPPSDCRLHGHNGIRKTPTGGVCDCDGIGNVFSDSSQRLRSLQENISAVERSIELSHITERRGSHHSSSDSSRDMSNITHRHKHNKNHIDTSFVTERPLRAYNTRGANSHTEPVSQTKNISQQSLFDDSFGDSVHMYSSLGEASVPSRVLRSGRTVGITSSDEDDHHALDGSHHELYSINEDEQESHPSTAEHSIEDDEDDEESGSEEEKEGEAETSKLR